MHAMTTIRTALIVIDMQMGMSSCHASDATFAFASKDFHGAARSAEDVHAMSLANLDGEYAAVLASAQLAGRAEQGRW